MATTIKALGTFRNADKLPGGIVRRGETATVEDAYARELVDGNKAEIVGKEPEDSGESDVLDVEPTKPLPDDTPKIGVLREAGIETFGDLAERLEAGDLQDVRGVGTATEGKLNAFIQDRA